MIKELLKPEELSFKLYIDDQNSEYQIWGDGRVGLWLFDNENPENTDIFDVSCLGFNDYWNNEAEQDFTKIGRAHV